ncbi:MAG TPA: polysaccharide deacetylase family protein [Planctomycetaceae bacterium]|nr:polysaccharide deacetylase family protein [Planctomycetaceae bacterium]
MTIALMYHDVTAPGHEDASGFAGPGAARYKLDHAEFDRHLERLAKIGPEPCLLTFDDGGVSAATDIADRLESRGWHGWFFITTDRIDTPAFLSKSQLRDLHQRGHVIGSHSCSHPLRMSYCPPTQLFDEWSRSRRVLEDILGAAVQTASVPGGFYSSQVGQAASLAGLTQLFTSEPTTRSWMIDRCTVHGRFTVYRGMSATDAAALVSSPLRRARQAGLWTAKKLAKQLGGTAYIHVRERLFRRAYAPATP